VGSTGIGFGVGDGVGSGCGCGVGSTVGGTTGVGVGSTGAGVGTSSKVTSIIKTFTVPGAGSPNSLDEITVKEVVPANIEVNVDDTSTPLDPFSGSP
jgi:hypothetical protein